MHAALPLARGARRETPPPSVALLLAAAAWSAFRTTPVGACPERMRRVNGLPLRQQAIVKDGVTYLPLRAVAESLGCTVHYSPKAGVFIWGGQQPSQVPGLPSDGAPAPSSFPPDPRPTAPQPPMPGRGPTP